MPNTPSSFSQSGLLQSGLVEKAYDLVAHFPRAVGSGRIMSEFFKDEHAVAAHLVAFTTPRMPAEDIERTFGSLVEQTVSSIRKVYDRGEKFPLRPGYSGLVQASFVACAIYDLEKFFKEWKDKPLDTSVVLSHQKEDRLVVEHMSLEQYLRRVRRTFEDETLPTAEYIGATFAPGMEKRFKQALGALDLKIATPEQAPIPRRPKPPTP